MVYCFFPETSGLELEDVDYLFEQGGITGGVFSSRGQVVQPGHHRLLTRAGETKEAIVNTSSA